MAGNVVELDKADVWLRDVEVQFRRSAVKGLHAAALRGVQMIVTQIIPARSPQPVDRGVYRSGWRPVLRADGADIENLEPHALFIEEGVRAANVKIGRPLIQALAEWAVRKRLATPKNAVSVAWSIAKTMQRRGIFGQRGLGVLRELVDNHLEQIIQEEVAREMEKGVR